MSGHDYSLFPESLINGGETSARSTPDAWCLALASNTAEEKLHSIVGSHDVPIHDSADVKSVHDEAREVFARLVERARGTKDATSGRSLVLLGEAGSGKTHLMRAFRGEVHENRRGYVAYLQMLSGEGDYTRYILSQVVDSLSRPYDTQVDSRSGLQRISDHLVNNPKVVDSRVLKKLKESEDPNEIRRAVTKISNDLIRYGHPLIRRIESDVLPALIYLQAGDPSITRCIPEFLRCKDLSQSAREMLAAIVPMTDAGEPLRVLRHLAQIISIVDEGAFVLLIDQLETNASDLAAAETQFRAAMQSVVEIVDRIPNAVLVVSCLKDFWTQFESRLSRSLLDRLLRDPAPVRLSASRSAEEAIAIVQSRLSAIYDAAGLAPKPNEPLYPFEEADLRSHLENKSAREIVETLRQSLARARAAGAPRPTLEAQPVTAPAASTSRVASAGLEEAFQVAVAELTAPLPDYEDGLARICQEAIQCGGQVALKLRGICTLPKDGAFECQLDWEDGRATKLFVAVCDRRAQGGGFAKQLSEADSASKGLPVAILRTGEYPPVNTKKPSVVAQQMAALKTRGWRFLSLTSPEWRSLMALPQFLKANAEHPSLESWLREASPLVSEAGMRGLFDREALLPLAKVGQQPATAAPSGLRIAVAQKTVASAGDPIAAPPGHLLLGSTLGIRPTKVSLDLQDLTRHAAVVGGSGSGKTTLSMHLLEQALLAGIPVIAVDRKGDLTSWAAPRNPETIDLSRRAEHERFREKVLVRLLTPGDSRGVDASLPILPSVAAEASEADIEEAASAARDALSSILGYKDGASDQKYKAILGKAITLLVEESRGERVTLADLIHFLENEDPALIAAIGAIDPKHVRPTAERLQSVLLNNERLLASKAEEIDIANLITPDPETGRTRLTIFAATGLTGEQSLIFWVSRFLASISSYAAKSPSDRLQAIVFLDEADRYFPAVGSPASKPAIENAVRRWRSAGIGLIVASQSPADFDYKCRDQIGTWFIGKVKESRAHEKLKPLFESGSGAELAKLPGLSVGHFFRLTGSSSVEFKAMRSMTPSSQLGEDEIRTLAIQNQQS